MRIATWALSLTCLGTLVATGIWLNFAAEQVPREFSDEEKAEYHAFQGKWKVISSDWQLTGPWTWTFKDNVLLRRKLVQWLGC
jgi:hypothetical protein